MSVSEDRKHRFERLVNDVQEPVSRYLKRRASAVDADDVLSDVLLTLWRRLDAVPESAPLPWCYGVARRCLANHRRGESRRLQLVAHIKAQPPTHLDPDAIDRHSDLAAAIETLSDADRELIALWAWEDLDPKEIAVVLGTTANAVSLRLARTKKKLADEIARQNPAYAGHKQRRHTQEQQHG